MSEPRVPQGADEAQKNALTTIPEKVYEGPVVSPLATVDPASVTELFSRDPLDMTNADIDAIIEHMRRERSTWETKQAQAEAKKQAKLNPQPAGTKITLADLDI